MTDEEILALTQLQMSTGDDAELSLLLHKQQAGLLTETERMRLTRLLQIYQRGLLRKALALAEAVRRGIHPPMDS